MKPTFCPVCAHQIKCKYSFCQHCIFAFTDFQEMHPDERHAYRYALGHWYLMNDPEDIYAALIFSSKMGKEHDYTSHECYACKTGHLDLQRICMNCGYIDLPIEKILRYELTTLETAVSRRRQWLISSKLPMVDYIEDYTNIEEVRKGIEEKRQRIHSALEKLRDELLNKISVAQEREHEINQVNFQPARSMQQALEEALDIAQKRVENVMYYGKEMVLPDSPFWNKLYTEQQKTMLEQHKVFRVWWDYVILISLLTFCFTAPFIDALPAILIGLGSLFIMSGFVVSFYSSKVGSLLKQVRHIMIIVGLAFLLLMSITKGRNIIIQLGGFLLLLIVAIFVSPLFRGLFWKIRNKVAK